ncbi:TPR repeat-containing protein [Myxococcus stipitatus DSM 14675]|uniref:TPR repeat-containing protein n=1 Tax=Myxococcus stipitatus (strain DSM 14675 / JCM 12634 / Mx s8) TaxID=1278073 RepID=L7U316_MYXSD|nr:TPR repeat-containing protein [Myxococcus stipitatus DSM 14675]
MDCSHASLQSTPEQAASFAAEALTASDFAHAAFHLGCALGADAERVEWLALLEKLARASGPEPLLYVPVDGRVSFATAAVHAWFLARSARTQPALELFAQVARTKPDADFARWGIAWLETPGAAESVAPDTAAALLSSVLSKSAREDQDTFARLLRITEVLVARPPAHVGVRWLQGTLLHRLGRLDDALAVARSAHAGSPGWLTATLLAGIHRARGELPQVLDAYLVALKHDAAHLSTRLDAADMRCEQGRVEEGLRWYEDILSQLPGEPWASASVAYHRFVQQGSREALETLLRLDDTRPGHDRTRALAREAIRRLRAFEDYLPSRTDAGIHALRHFVLQPPSASDSGPLTLTTSWVEAPSVQLAWELHRLWRGFPPPMELSVRDVQKPDPRLPSGLVEFTRWSYSGTRPTRAVPRPAPEVAAALAGLASLPFQGSSGGSGPWSSPECARSTGLCSGLTPWCIHQRHRGRTRHGPDSSASRWQRPSSSHGAKKPGRVHAAGACCSPWREAPWTGQWRQRCSRWPGWRRRRLKPTPRCSRSFVSWLGIRRATPATRTRSSVHTCNSPGFSRTNARYSSGGDTPSSTPRKAARP